MTSSNRVQVVERAIDLLLALAETPATLTSLSQSTDLSPSTTYRILSTLSYRGLVQKNSDSGEYQLGPGLIYLLARLAHSGGGLALLAQDYLRLVTEKTGETATLHIRVGIQRVCIAECPSPATLRYTAGVGTPAPLHVGSAGKTILAFMREEERHRALKELDLAQLTENTITSRETLDKELVRIVQTGYGIRRGERVMGAAAISVPIIYKGDVYAVLSILGPAPRLPNHVLKQHLPLLTQVAGQLAAVVEGTQDHDPDRIT